MSRLYELSYNEEQWNVTGNREIGYKLVNKENYESFKFSGDIIGFEQIENDTFLVYERTMRDEWAILRYKLSGEGTIEYKKAFREFEFLTKDKIIFDKDSSVSCMVYSISENCEIDVGHIIGSENHDASFCQGREIELYIDDEQDMEYPKYMEVKYKFGHQNIEYIQLVLDPETLQIIRPAYSTMHDECFEISENLSLKELVQEVRKCVSIIDDYLYDLYNKDNTKEIQELIEHVK